MTNTQTGMRAHRTYTPEQVERCLIAVAVCGGNTRAAAENLAASGLEVPDRTLREWRNVNYRERYLEVVQQRAPEIEKAITAQLWSSVIRAAEVQERAWEAQMQQLDEGSVRDPSAVARNAAVSQGIGVEKALLMQGRPTHIHADRGASELLRSLAQIAPGLVVDGDAVEIPAGQLSQSSASDNDLDREPVS